MTESRRVHLRAPTSLRSLLLPSLAALAVACADAGEPRTAELERLTQETNGLDSFVAWYQVTSADGAQSILRLVYQAPDKAKMELTAAASDNVAALSTSMLLGSQLSVVASLGSDQTAKGQFDVQMFVEGSRKVEALLGELFPGVDVGPNAPANVTFTLDWGAKSATAKPFITFGTAFVPHRTALLGWLEKLRDMPSREGATGTLDFDIVDTFKIELSKESGFIERVTGESEGRVSTFVLSKLELHAPIDASEFEMRDVGPNAADITGQIVQPVADAALAAERRMVFNQVDGLVAKGQLAWDDGARAKLRQVLELAHTGIMPHVFRPWIEDTQAKVGALEQKVRADAGQAGADRATLQADVSSKRADLVATLDHVRDSYGQQLKMPEPAGEDAARWQEYLEINKKAAAVVFEETVAKPTLAYFDEHFATVFDG